MSKYGKVDFSDLQKELDSFDKFDKQRFYEMAAKDLAARILSKVVKRTPVGQYPSSTGKNGGTLRRGWTIGEVIKSGNMYQIEIINPVEYSSYVEYGHRTRDHKGWVAGRFMLTISEQELDAQAPKILEKKLMKYLGECFNDQ